MMLPREPALISTRYRMEKILDLCSGAHVMRNGKDTTILIAPPMPMSAIEPKTMGRPILRGTSSLMNSVQNPRRQNVPPVTIAARNGNLFAMNPAGNEKRECRHSIGVLNEGSVSALRGGAGRPTSGKAVAAVRSHRLQCRIVPIHRPPRNYRSFPSRFRLPDLSSRSNPIEVPSHSSRSEKKASAQCTGIRIRSRKAFARAITSCGNSDGIREFVMRQYS